MTRLSVAVTVDRERHLRYDWNAIAEIEAHFGDVSFETLYADVRGVGLNKLRVLVWGGLRWEDPTLTISKTGEILSQYLDDGGDLEILFEKVTDALEAAGFAEKEKGDGDRPEVGSRAEATPSGS